MKNPAVIVAVINVAVFLVLMFQCAAADLNFAAGVCLLIATVCAMYARSEYLAVRRARESLRRPPFTTTDHNNAG